MKKPKMERREFIKLALVGSGALSAVAVATKKKGGNDHSEITSKHSWAMVIDQSKCIGCESCIYACQASNDINPDLQWNKLYETGNQTKNPIPVACQHCEHAPCVSVCPVGASYYREDGIVMMDYDLCIGCRYCQVACPYGARTFNWETFTGENPYVPEWGEPDVERRERGVAEKCTFCYQRIDRGLAHGLTPGVDKEATPACVNACPTGARIFGDLNDPNSKVSQIINNSPYFQLKEDLGTHPRVYYLPANNKVGN